MFLLKYYMLLHPDDDLVDCLTPEGAQEYVDRILGIASKDDQSRIICAFFGIRQNEFRIRNRHPKQPRQDAKDKTTGGSEATESLSRMDLRFYRVMAAADTHHDFDEYFQVTNLMNIEPAVRASRAAVSGLQFPRGMTGFPQDEANIVRMLSSPERLEFGDAMLDDGIPNPVHGADRLQNTFFDLERMHQEFPDLSLDGLVEANRTKVSRIIGGGAKLVAIDVVTHFPPPPSVVPVAGDVPLKQKRSAILKLLHLADLTGLLRNKLGPDACFAVDCTGDSLVQVMLGLTNVSKAFLRRFTVFHEDAPLISDVSEKLMSIVRDRCIYEESTMRSFEVMLTDANLFDASTKTAIALSIDPRPTGPVFHPDFDVQVELHGIHRESGRPHKVFLDATLTDLNGSMHALSFKNGVEVTRTVSKNAVLRSVQIKLGQRTNDATSTSYLDELSIQAALSLKCAGDWGQVENCKRYGKTFVTADKMAALYAWYRQVPFVFMKTTDNLIVDGQPQQSPNLPEYVKYTFVVKWRYSPAK